MSTKKERINNIKKQIAKDYGICLEDRDIYLWPGYTFISTRKAAELFNTSYHNFTNKCVKPLVKSGVTRISFGRSRYYKLEHLIVRLKKIIAEDKSLFVICKELINKKSKKSRRKSNARTRK